MGDERELIAKHLLDLYRKADRGGYFLFSSFLGLNEQSVLKEIWGDVGRGCKLFGGAEGCERVMARFGNEDEGGYDAPFPILTLKAEPVSPKFADKLTHRDVLGAIMNLGIERDVIGDIVLRDNAAYIFVKEEMGDYLLSSLTRIKHTDVHLTTVTDLPEGELYKTERRKIQLSGERVDAVVAKVFNLSRDDSQTLIKRGLVFRNGALVTSPSQTPKPLDRISVRGHGRFIYLGYDSDTRKGKMNILVDLYV
jgi:RNA-binding protein YlmH